MASRTKKRSGKSPSVLAGASVSKIKPVSQLRRYEYLREKGVMLKGGVVLKGKELDDYVDEQIWRDAHPGENPCVVF